MIIFHSSIITKMPGVFFLLIFFFLSSESISQPEITLTWTEAINLALAENPYLASTESSLEATKANIKIARADYLPAIGFGGSISESKKAVSTEVGVIPATSGQLSATLSQMVYNEKYLANHKIQKYLYASQEEQLRNTRYSIISTTGQAYIDLQFALDLLGVQQANMAITDTNLRAARDRQEVGSTNMQEVLRWETEMYGNRQSVESQKATVIVSRAGLNQVLNLPLETDNNLEVLTIAKAGFIFSSQIVAAAVTDENGARYVRDFLVDLGLGNSPILASIEQELMAQQRQVKSNQRWAVPSFDFSAQTAAIFGELDDPSAPAGSNDIGFWKVGLSMKWPIITGGANVNKARQARSQMSALELERDNLKTSLEQSIRATTAIAMSDFINIGLASAQADAAQKNYDLVYDSYLVGESDLLNLLDAQDQKIGADISSRIALYTFFADMLIVEQEIGYFPFLEPADEADQIIKELENRLLETR